MSNYLRPNPRPFSPLLKALLASPLLVPPLLAPPVHTPPLLAPRASLPAAATAPLASSPSLNLPLNALHHTAPSIAPLTRRALHALRQPRLRLATFERWYLTLYDTIRPDSEWRGKLALSASERMLKRTRPATVRDHPFGVPGMLLLTSERLLFGTVAFFTAASLSALQHLERLEINWGDCAIRLSIEGPGAEPLLLRFGRSVTARAERDDWLATLEEMRRAYGHAWALGSERFRALPHPRHRALRPSTQRTPEHRHAHPLPRRRSQIIAVC